MSASRRWLPAWLFQTVAAVLGANLLAGRMTGLTIELMRGVTPFARASREHELAILPWWQIVVYGAGTLAVLRWLAPIVAWYRADCPRPAPVLVERRTIEAPVAIGAIGFACWLAGPAFFAGVTFWHFGRWSPDLMSQQVLSPLVNGFLASTTSYLLVDWIFRRCVVPTVFPDGRLADVREARGVGVRGRLLVFLVAVAFLPQFALLGLVRASAARVAAGLPADVVLGHLVAAAQALFVVFVVLGIGLTLLLAGTLTRPLSEIAAALLRVRSGDPSGSVAVTSADEVGFLADGVNALLATLRDRARILDAFGRVVEPSVRDRLLAGDLEPGGEVRPVTVLFCDLRGFTALAERTPPGELLSTLNAFFAEMAAGVRESGGFVAKFVGDGLLAVFGLFDEAGPAAGAAAAVRCVDGLRRRLASLNTARVAAGREPLTMKIGVHAGQVVAGTVGAADRHEYTVVGDTVNVAARLEKLCGTDGHDVLVSETAWTLAAAAGAAPEGRAHGSVSLRGRDEPVRVYRLA